MPTRPLLRRAPLVAALAALALSAAAAGSPAPGLPAAGAGTETPQAAARRALEERDVPFEAHAFVAAAAEGDLCLVDLFLEAGMPASARDRWGSSALLEAARANRPEVVSRLLARGARPGEAQGGEPPLVAAAEAGSLEALVALLAAGADPDQAADPARGPGGTPLQRACAAEAWEAARLLLEAHASPSAAAPALAAPLLIASESGHAPTVALLLGKGAAVTARGPGGETPLALSVRNGHVEVVRLLLVVGAGAKGERSALLAGRPGQALKPEIRRLLKSPPKPAAVQPKPR